MKKTNCDLSPNGTNLHQIEYLYSSDFIHQKTKNIKQTH